MKNLKNRPRKLLSCLRVMAITLLITPAISIYAQKNDTISKQAPQKKEEEFYAPFSTSWEKQAEYPGGFEALKKFIESEMKYPQIAKENGIQGRVITNFIIEKDGTLTDPKVVRGVDPLLDQEAVRILKAMTAKWIPGEQTGKIVRVRFTLPIVFKLPKDETAEIDSDDIVRRSSLEKQPEFPGGSQALIKYLEENLRHLPIHVESSIVIEVITNFIVHKDGSISDINIIKGFDTSINAEAVRVISNMPNWEPGIQKGEVVNVRYRLPIMFNLKSDEEPTKAEDEVFEVVSSRTTI